MPPRSRNHLDPTAPDPPTAIPASSLVMPSAILPQNDRSTSRRIGGRPGDLIAGRPVCVTIHPGCRPINTSSVGDSYDNDLPESVNGLYEAELIHTKRLWESAEAVELATMDWITWWNTTRLHEALDYASAAEIEATYTHH